MLLPWVCKASSVVTDEPCRPRLGEAIRTRNGDVNRARRAGTEVSRTLTALEPDITAGTECALRGRLAAATPPDRELLEREPATTSGTRAVTPSVTTVPSVDLSVVHWGSLATNPRERIGDGEGDNGCLTEVIPGEAVRACRRSI